MRRWTDIAITAARWTLGIFVLIALLLLGLLRTPPGQSVLAEAVKAITGDTVTVQGLRGSLPDDLHADMVEIADKNGVWLRAENVSLDWDALAALNNQILIRRVTASRIAMLRMPLPSEESNGTTPEIEVGALALPRIEIAQPVVGHAALLGAQGSLRYISVHQAQANLAVARLDSPDRYRIDGAIDHDVANGTVSIDESARGILAGFIGLPGLGPIHLSAQAAGDANANTIAFRLSAGALTASGQGTLALATQSADIDFSA
ncbi:MAG TPA: hypothetical protein VG867_09295, partial [Rhizomicrobium sp.]|nr:hypothetical protein [Rhizomicrobium sp.]